MIEGLDKLLEGRGQPGLPELRDLLQELLGGPSVEGTFLGHSCLKRQSMRVFRLRFSINGGLRSWVVKRLSPVIAHSSG